MENKLKHLEMIQGVVGRMASNSFALKGWAVTLVAGIFVLAQTDTEKLYFIVAYIPIIAFWLLDAYYLRLERLYRALYNKARALPEDEIDFSMDVQNGVFTDKGCKYCNCVFSPTELWFYIPLAIVTTAIIILHTSRLLWPCS